MSKQAQIAELLRVVETIFTSKQQNSDITKCTITTNTGVHAGRWFGADKSIRGFDFTTQQGDKVIQLRVLEQNPNKTDNYNNFKTNALLAQKGHKIAWVIRRDTDKFIGKIMDGQFEAIKPRATTTVSYASGGYKQQNVTGEDQYNQSYTCYNNDEWISNLPEICAEDVIGIVGG